MRYESRAFPFYSSMRLLLLLFFGLMVANSLSAQVGGRTTYNFLRLAPGARLTALGGSSAGTYEADVNLAFFNPALYSAELNQHLGVSYVNYIADVNHGMVSYAHQGNAKYGSFGGGIQFINYGSFTRRDAAGVEMGEFNAGELALQMGWGYQFNPLMRVGANVKLIGSYLEEYTSHGMAMDMSAMYIDTSRNLTLTLLVRNFGMQFDPYVAGNREALPLDIQIGITNKLRYMPLRWGIVFHNLHRWGIAYNDPNDTYYRRQILLNNGEVAPAPETTIADEIFRHVILNGEFLLSKNFHVRMGYNHQRRKELTLPERNGSSGFSFGFGIQVKKFRFDYGRGAISLAGMTNNFSITTNLSNW